MCSPNRVGAIDVLLVSLVCSGMFNVMCNVNHGEKGKTTNKSPLYIGLTRVSRILVHEIWIHSHVPRRAPAPPKEWTQSVDVP